MPTSGASDNGATTTEEDYLNEEATSSTGKNMFTCRKCFETGVDVESIATTAPEIVTSPETQVATQTTSHQTTVQSTNSISLGKISSSENLTCIQFYCVCFK